MLHGCPRNSPADRRIGRDDIRNDVGGAHGGCRAKALGRRWSGSRSRRGRRCRRSGRGLRDLDLDFVLREIAARGFLLCLFLGGWRGAASARARSSE